MALLTGVDIRKIVNKNKTTIQFDVKQWFI